MHDQCLAIRQTKGLGYPNIAPFDPDEAFCELTDITVSALKNDVYRRIRQLFIDLQLDKKHLDTPEWSPMSELLSPGNTVVIKPNLVLHAGNEEMQTYLTTHPSILRPIIDYCWKALNHSGLIVVGDAPSAEANFDILAGRLGLRDMVEKLRSRGVNVELHDFRVLKVLTENGVWVGEQEVTSDTPSSQIINLGRQSMFAIDKYKDIKLHGAGYDIKATNQHHSGDTQEYRVSKRILNADVVISVPKLKTHRKAGLTCCLKNLVGINCDKNYLPHFAMGSTNMGGDEMPAIDGKNILFLRSYNWVREHIIGAGWKVLGRPGVRFLRLLKCLSHELTTVSQTEVKTTSAAKDYSDTETDLAGWLHSRLSGQPVAAGAWAGNETICRMILDLNRIFLCCDKNGNLKDKTDRKVFYVVDGIEMGMGNGPTSPTPLNAGLLAAGWNGYELDTGILRLFGVDPDCITLYSMAKNEPWMFANNDGDKMLNGEILHERDLLSLKILPPDGWSFTKLHQV